MASTTTKPRNRNMSRLGPVALSLCLLRIITGTLVAAQTAALPLSASPDWHGVDGDWSSLRLYVGRPPQQLDVVVSTSLSEIWLVHDTDCAKDDACIRQRGGFYDADASKTWSALDIYQLGLGELGVTGNGDYGTDTVAAARGVGQQTTGLNTQVVATVNGTTPYTGYFGLGITPQKYGQVVEQSTISNLVERDGFAPSHSYGYTAGARHIGVRGTPMSLTLGGYDQSRFTPHEVVFPLSRTNPQPQVRLRSITTSVADEAQAPTSWSSPTRSLLHYNESVPATIDSSTPYLWLPRTVADRFADAYGLTWSESYKLYVFKDSSSALRFRDAQVLSLTFTVSGFNDPGNSNDPLTGPAVLNLTISGRAFYQNLRYPFVNMQKGAGDVPYFPLRRSLEGGQITIGRVFLQETYLLTSYESQSFQLYQAQFPDDPVAQTNLVTMPFQSGSMFPGPPASNSGMSSTQIVGIVVGTCLFCIMAAALAIFLLKRGRKASQNRPKSMYDDQSQAGQHKSPFNFMSLIPSKRKSDHPEHSRAQFSRGLSGSTLHSSQQFSTKTYERYETPTPTIPIELTRWGATLPDNATGYSTRQYEDWTMYHEGYAAQSEGPVGGQWAAQQYAFDPVKSARDVTQADTYRAHDIAPQSLPKPSSLLRYGNGPPKGLAPVHAATYGSVNHYANIPSPVPLLQAEDRSDAGSMSTDEGYDSELDRRAAQVRGPDGSRAAGSLGILTIPEQSHTTDALNSADSNGSFEFTLPVMPSARGEVRHSSSSSLGSDFTVEEEEREEATRAAARLDRLDGPDLVHIPQPAARRYSWEG